jgi:hypothetical protein
MTRSSRRNRNWTETETGTKMRRRISNMCSMPACVPIPARAPAPVCAREAGLEAGTGAGTIQKQKEKQKRADRLSSMCSMSACAYPSAGACACTRCLRLYAPEKHEQKQEPKQGLETETGTITSRLISSICIGTCLVSVCTWEAEAEAEIRVWRGLTHQTPPLSRSTNTIRGSRSRNRKQK